MSHKQVLFGDHNLHSGLLQPLLGLHFSVVVVADLSLPDFLNAFNIWIVAVSFIFISLRLLGDHLDQIAKFSFGTIERLCRFVICTVDGYENMHLQLTDDVDLSFLTQGAQFLSELVIKLDRSRVGMELNVPALSLIDMRPQLRVNHALTDGVAHVAWILLCSVVTTYGHVKVLLEVVALGFNVLLRWIRLDNLLVVCKQHWLAFLCR